MGRFGVPFLIMFRQILTSVIINIIFYGLAVYWIFSEIEAPRGKK